jgi:hypothetical protein
VRKFDEHFFLKSKSLTAKNEEAKMGQSFYRKDGLDFLAFSYAEGFSKLNNRVCTRVDKIEQHLSYWQDLLQFYQFAGKTAERFARQAADKASMPDLQSKIKQFLELYQVYSLEYDVFDLKYREQFSLFVVSS